MYLEHSRTDAAQDLGAGHDTLLVPAYPHIAVNGVYRRGTTLWRPQLDGVLNSTGCQNWQGWMALHKAQHKILCLHDGKVLLHGLYIYLSVKSTAVVSIVGCAMCMQMQHTICLWATTLHKATVMLSWVPILEMALLHAL